MEQLMTPWGEEILRLKDKDDVLKEYPRPQMVRDSYLCLNGIWDYAFTDKEEVPDHFDGEILVPFSPETLLSGVGRILKPGEWLHYRKRFTLPEHFNRGRVLLHFGAVDQECTVYFNGVMMGRHKGGYLEFSCDITGQLTEGENELIVSVQDFTETVPHARGKQKLVKKGMMGYLWYTPQSGIWKPVWLESVPEIYIDQFRITPLYDEKKLQIDLLLNKTAEVPVELVIPDMHPAENGDPVRIISRDGHYRVTVKLSDFRSWTPEDPYLYDFVLKAGDDEIRSYFAMRKIGHIRDERGLYRFTLNNKVFFFNGVLDQGYWPESLMTPPSDEALASDILKIREMGFNTIRKHVKVESDRFYYHCDRLGMLVWQDMPNGGGEYNMTFVTYLPTFVEGFGRIIKDDDYLMMKRGDAAGRRQYRQDLKAMVGQLYNHPCIAAWVPFNEGWGQFSARKATELIRKADPTRLVNEACGWFDQGGGDMYTIHNYMHKLKIRPADDRVIALSEFGGYAFAVEGHTACERRFGYKTYESLEDLNDSYEKLIREQILPAVPEGLCAAIYTQTSDIEEETNGLMTYDRRVTKFDPEKTKALCRAVYDALERP